MNGKDIQPLCEEGHPPDLYYYLARIKAFADDNPRDCALINACEEGHLDEVSLLLANGANVNFEDFFGVTALIYACQEGHLDIVSLLLDNGANVNSKDSKGLTALIYACKEGHLGIVSLLLENGANVNSEDFFRVSALIYACKGGYIEIVSLLLANGANVYDRDEFGNYAFHLVSIGKSAETIEEIEQLFLYYIRNPILMLLEGCENDTGHIGHYLFDGWVLRAICQYLTLPENNTP